MGDLEQRWGTFVNPKCANWGKIRSVLQKEMEKGHADEKRQVDQLAAAPPGAGEFLEAPFEHTCEKVAAAWHAVKATAEVFIHYGDKRKLDHVPRALEDLSRELAIATRETGKALAYHEALQNRGQRRASAEDYETLEDAFAFTGDPRFKGGRAEIWYVKKPFFRDFIFGVQSLEDEGKPLPTLRTLPKTHVQLGTLDERNLETIYRVLQGENWSRGRANNMLRKMGLGHTSMSVGDIVKIGNRLYIVDVMGFTEL